MNLSVVVQAGGESRRMGRNKALASFRGQPLVQRVCKRLAGLGDELLVTTNQPEAFQFLGLRMQADPVPGRGALGGLLAALTGARSPLVAVVACDMPFASRAILELACLRIEGFDVAIPRTEHGLEPLHAVYRRETCLAAVRDALEAGAWRVDSWFSKARVTELLPVDWGRVDPTGRAFLNVNTEQDLQEAAELD